jgi:hypothetical protein
MLRIFKTVLNAVRYRRREIEKSARNRELPSQNSWFRPVQNNGPMNASTISPIANH